MRIDRVSVSTNMLRVTPSITLSIKVILQITWWNLLATKCTCIDLSKKRLRLNRKTSENVPLCLGDTGSSPVVGIARKANSLNSHLRFKSNFFISRLRGIFLYSMLDRLSTREPILSVRVRP